jgi:transcriptional regulator with XRE-family HTH domain
VIPTNIKGGKPSFTNPDWRIGQFLAHQRKKFGIASQADFAKRLGVSRFHLANIESGRTPLRMDIAWKACRELKIHPGFLISDGAAYRLPFEVLDGGAVDKADALISAKCTAKFIDFWPALYELLFSQTDRPQTPSKKEFDSITVKGNTGGVKSETQKLRDDLKRATGKPGMKAALARFMKVEPPRVSEWLAGQEPSGEYALKLRLWADEQLERKRTK